MDPKLSFFSICFHNNMFILCKPCKDFHTLDLIKILKYQGKYFNKSSFSKLNMDEYNRNHILTSMFKNKTSLVLSNHYKHETLTTHNACVKYYINLPQLYIYSRGANFKSRSHQQSIGYRNFN